MRNTINSTDTLIIRSRMSSGAVYTVELQQQPRTDADIQQYIDTITDDRETVISVWRVECHEVNGIPLVVEDITDRFDVRSAAEIEETAVLARVQEDDAPDFRRRLASYYGTYHVSGGRVA